MFIAGPFSSTWNGLSLGVTDRGFDLRYRPMGEDIMADNAGDVVQATIFRGIEVTLAMVLSEYNAPGLFAAMWPWAADQDDNTTWGTMLPPGLEEKSTFAKDIILTSCLWDTTLPAETPSTLLVATPPAAGAITFHKCVLQNNADVEISYNSRHRKVPLVMRVYAVPADYSPNDPSPATEAACPTSLKFFDAT